MAARQQVTARDLHARGTVHRVVAEPTDDTSADLARAVAAECAAALRAQTPSAALVAV